MAERGRGGRAGPRGLSREAMVQGAIALMEESGDEGFSLRKLAQRLACDPMALIYHFGSKEGLERAMADALNAELAPAAASLPWRTRLADLASQYRRVAVRYPRTFPLLQRFWVTGPADYVHAETIYAAFAEAGFTGADLVDACFGWYAAILGLAAAEAGGLLRPAGPAELAEVEALPAEAFPLTKQLLPAFRAQEAGRAYALAVESLIDGLARRAGGRGAG